MSDKPKIDWSKLVEYSKLEQRSPTPPPISEPRKVDSIFDFSQPLPKRKPKTPKTSSSTTHMLLGAIVALLLLVALPFLWLVWGVSSIPSALAKAQSGDTAINSGLRIADAEYSYSLLGLKYSKPVFGVAFTVSVRNDSWSVKSHADVLIRVRREGRPLPDDECHDFVEIKGGIKSGETLTIRAVATNTQLGNDPYTRKDTNRFYEISLDGTNWVKPKL